MGMVQNLSKEASQLSMITQAQHALIFAPYYGTPIPIIVRHLTPAQIKACGTFSAIELFEDKLLKERLQSKADIHDIIEYAETHHKICKKAMAKPTYQEVIKSITDINVMEQKEKLKEMKARLRETKSGPERQELEHEIDIMLVWTNLLLPDDFTAVIVSYILGIDRSDIKEIDRQTLLNAAILAKRGKNNPADHVIGNFEPWMPDDINSRAWVVFDEEMKKRKRA